MTTDRCIHRIAHNTAQARVAYGVFSRAPVRAPVPSLFPVSPALRHFPYASFCLPPDAPSILPSSSPSSERERRGEKERASERAYARPHYPRSRRAPRSLIVHRNRNCVPASHARGLPRSRNVRPTFAFVRRRVSTLPSSGARVTGNRRLRSTVARAIDKSHVCLSSGVGCARN